MDMMAGSGQQIHRVSILHIALIQCFGRRQQLEARRIVKVEEDASHLFIHCIKIQPIWWETMSWINIKGAFPLNTKHHFLQHSFLQVEGIRIKRWQYWWLAVTWSTWQLRNKILFSEATFDGNKLFEDATFLMWTWLCNLEKDFTMHFNQWSSNLRQGFLQQ